jgi:hypothetical protein
MTSHAEVVNRIATLSDYQLCEIHKANFGFDPFNDDHRELTREQVIQIQQDFADQNPNAFIIPDSVFSEGF